MMQSAHDRESDDEQRLARWLREAGSGALDDVAGPVARGRAALLEQLEADRGDSIAAATPANGWSGILRAVAGHRVVVGGIAASTLLAIALVFAAINSGQQLSAMERMAQQLRAITSYNYRLHWQTEWQEEAGTRALMTQGDGTTWWRTPDAFRNEMTIDKFEQQLPGGKRTKKKLEHFAEIFPPGERGLLIDYLRRTYVRLPFEPTGSKTYPWDVLRMIREESYDIERELGKQFLGDVNARGYVLILRSPRKGITVRDPVELWVDEQTDLPIEFSYGGTNAGSTYETRATDFRWNVEVDPKLFEATPPAGFADITPPTDAKDLESIAEALRLYAKLDGGHYPQTTTIDSAMLVQQMKKRAGFEGPEQPAWASDKTYQQIEQAAAGFDWIVRILRNRFLSGYRGNKVSPADKDQVLLWWMASDNRYRLYFGDLRTEVVSEEQWARLVPNAEE